MKANELRIGNYYQDELGNVKVVTPNTIEDVWNAQRSWCKRIPLTTEWLEKFGIEFKDEDKLYWVKGAFNLERNIDDDYEYYFEVYSHYIPVKWVHQLQNLYFTLTGEELTQTIK